MLEKAHLRIAKIVGRHLVAAPSLRLLDVFSEVVESGGGVATECHPYDPYFNNYFSDLV
jgi:hypothetical protein